MLLAERAVFAGFHSLRMRLLILGQVIITMLALGAFQSNSRSFAVSHEFSLPV